jgi:hypothetical protein
MHCLYRKLNPVANAPGSVLVDPRWLVETEGRDRFHRSKRLAARSGRRLILVYRDEWGRWIFLEHFDYFAGQGRLFAGVRVRFFTVRGVSARVRGVSAHVRGVSAHVRGVSARVRGGFARVRGAFVRQTSVCRSTTTS